jgi:hypothetical protein
VCLGTVSRQDQLIAFRSANVLILDDDRAVVRHYGRWVKYANLRCVGTGSSRQGAA